MEVEVFNPHNKKLEELPTIYGFNNGGKSGWYHGQLIAEDGTPLGGHICSHESFMLGDLGILKGTRKDRHEGFKRHYPDGYKMEFVSLVNVMTHEGLTLAYKHNQEGHIRPPEDVNDPKVVVTVSNEDEGNLNHMHDPRMWAEEGKCMSCDNEGLIAKYDGNDEMKVCEVCYKKLESGEIDQCMDCKKFFPSKDLNDGSCDCRSEHCIHDSMHDGQRCSKCFSDRETDIAASISDWEM
jgi:hypothetical protein